MVQVLEAPKATWKYENECSGRIKASLDTQLKSIIFYSSTSSSGHQQGEVKLLALYRLLWKAYV